MSALNDPALAAELLEAVRHADGSASRVSHIDQAQELGGGSISRAFRLLANGKHWFLKLNGVAHHAMFAAEADGLAALARCASIRVPRVVASGVCGEHAYLLLDYLELAPFGCIARRTAGAALADLHRLEGRRFGWPRDNFIGSTPQQNTEDSDWPRFFSRRRLAPQIELARSHGVKRRIIADGERLLEKLPVFFASYTPAASLLHGDLWSGNAALDETGRLTLFDPAVHYGDRESDLAMMQLFGGFPAGMFAAYEEAWPLDAGFAQRRTLYQLYHVLNHLNLFGAGYQAQAERMIGSLLAEAG
ncbi:MAG: fructosamine kinase family protein [Propionivibrio sp.]